MDYRALGLKCGLEVHQQLATHKLFCECPSHLDAEVGSTFLRRLRPTQSELGEVDAAAVEEARRKLAFVYETTRNTCLVEADEEPPHDPNEEALDVTLMIALLLNADPVPEVHFMRKIVIDGSNTTGFQRSALVAMGGHIDVNGKRIGVPTILLEEDAARKVSEAEGEVRYRLDRLGIPLVEVSTTPDIETPDEARDVALAIGSLLRATRKVLRGIGTIREDVNISIRGGARIEIKGVQELGMIATFVEKEAARQLLFLDVAEELHRRGVGSVTAETKDVTSIFARTESKVVRTALKKGGKVLAWPLRGFAGLLKSKLGPELAAHARVAGVGGIFHSDELPAYGISEGEVDAVRTALRLGLQDAFVLVAEAEAKARAAIDEMRPRAEAAIAGVPEETREPRPDGSSVYSRPLPGRARMYPETDVPPVRVTTERLARIRKRLPERPEVTVARLVREYRLHEQQARQLVQEGRDAEFDEIVRDGADPRLAASVLLYQFAEIRREGIDVDSISPEETKATFALVREGAFAKEAIPDVFRHMARSKATAADAVVQLGLARASQEDVERIVEEIIASNPNLVSERGEGAFAPLMGLVMERLRGRADGKVVSEVLRARLRKEKRKEKAEKRGRS